MTSLTTKIARGTFFLSLGNFVSRFFSFITVIVATRGLSLFEYGVVMLVLSVTGPVNSISGLGMDELIVADTAKSLGEGRAGSAKKLLLSFFKIKILIISLLILIGWFFRVALEARYGPAIREYFFLIVFLVLAQYLRNSFNIIFQIHQKFFELSLLSVLDVLVRFTAVILFWQFSILNIHTAIASYVLSALIPALICLPWIFKIATQFYRVPQEAEGIFWLILKRHGKWQMALDVVSSIISNIKYWLIKIFLSTEAVAVFSVAQSMYSAVASLLPMKSVIFPIIAERSNEPKVMRSLVARSTKYSLIFYLGLLAVSWFIAPTFIKVFFPKYLIGIFIFQLMALRLPLNAFSISQAPLLTVLKEQRYVFFLAIVNAVSVIILMPLLMLKWGIAGAAVEGLITVILIISLREIYLRRKHHISSVSLRSFFIVDEYDKIILNRIKDKFLKRKSGVDPA